jgi:hypothetical protein
MSVLEGIYRKLLNLDNAAIFASTPDRHPVK